LKSKRKKSKVHLRLKRLRKKLRRKKLITLIQINLMTK